MSSDANAQLIYNKCHLVFLKSRPSLDDSIVKEIESGKLEEKEACLKLLDKAKLYEKKGIFEPTSKTGLKIIENLAKFHRSWFSKYNLNLNTADHANTDLYDIYEAAYLLTFNMFNSQKNFSDIFMGAERIIAKRKTKEKETYLQDKDIWGKRQRRWSEESLWKVGSIDNDVYDFGPEYFWKPKLVELGKIYGFKLSDGKENFQVKTIGNKKKKFFINKSLGGGLLGSPSYVLAYADHILKKNDGVKYFQRRWANSIFEELMCRNLPVLKEAEVEKYIVKESTETFFKKTNCMSCHATLDNAAAVIRNVSLEVMGDDLVHKTNKAIFENDSNEKYMKIGVKNEKFYSSKVGGWVVYKDTDNKLYEKRIESLDDLGSFVSSNIDTYKCMTKKYIYLLTGRKISIEKPGINMSAKEIKIYEQLYKDFYLRRDLLELVKSIITSELFRE